MIDKNQEPLPAKHLLNPRQTCSSMQYGPEVVPGDVMMALSSAILGMQYNPTRPSKHGFCPTGTLLSEIWR